MDGQPTILVWGQIRAIQDRGAQSDNTLPNGLPWRKFCHLVLVPFVWAPPPISNSEIAIMTEQTIAAWEAICLKPSIQLPPGHLLRPFLDNAINVIDGQKLRFSFATANTLAAVIGVNRIPQSLVSETAGGLNVFEILSTVAIRVGQALFEALGTLYSSCNGRPLPTTETKITVLQARAALLLPFTFLF